MSISQNFPEEGPTLNLNFAGSRTLDPRITFTRTSTATVMGREGLIEVVPANTPRFDHRYVNGEIESLGLLIEESRVNYALRSEEFNLSPNSAINASISPNAAIAPDGTLTADKLVEDNISSTFKRVQQGGFTVIGDFTVSFFVKEAGRYRGYIQLLGTTNASVSFNLQDGTASGVVPSRTKIEPYPNGWYRVSTSNTFNAVEIPTVYIVMLSDSGQTTYTGDGSSGLYIWGLQVEQGSFPTSYIPTSGSTSTRTPDNASMVGENFSSWFNFNQGTFFARHKVGVGRTSAGSHVYSADLNFQNRISAQYAFLGAGENLNRFRSFVRYNGTIFGDFSPDDSAIEGIFHKTSHSYSITNTTQYLNGSIVGVGTTPTGLPVPIKFEIGKYMEIYDYLNGNISQITYYPTAISNNNLESLTR